jgi:hypothetical protein
MIAIVGIIVSGVAMSGVVLLIGAAVFCSAVGWALNDA